MEGANSKKSSHPFFIHNKGQPFKYPRVLKQFNRNNDSSLNTLNNQSNSNEEITVLQANDRTVIMDSKDSSKARRIEAEDDVQPTRLAKIP